MPKLWKRTILAGWLLALCCGSAGRAAAEPAEPSLRAAPVRVTADRPEENISTTRLQGDEILSLPGALGDPLRAAQASPALTAESDFDARLFVRGSAPEDSRVVLDGIAAGFPFHFYGLASTVDAAILKDLALYAGGFPVEYGDTLGGVLALRTRAAARPEAGFHLNLIQGGAHLAAPLGESGQVLASFRRGFYNLVLSGWSEAAVLPVYDDYFLQAAWADTRLYLWGSDDTASIRSTLPTGGSGLADLRQQSRCLALVQRWSWEGIECSALGQLLAEGQNYFFDERNSFAQDPRSAALTLQARTFAGPAHRLEARAEFSYREPQVDVRVADLFDAAQGLGPGQRLAVSDRLAYHVYGATLSDRVLLAPDWTLTAGLRWDATTYNGRSLFSPRAQLEYVPDPRQSYRLAAGVYRQEPAAILLAAQSGADRSGIESGQALHLVAGWELRPDPRWRLSLEAYDKEMSHLSSLTPDLHLASDGRGDARGLELQAQADWAPEQRSALGYAWSRSERWLPETGAWAPFDNDRTHQVSLRHESRFGENGLASLRWTWATGQPFTPAGGSVNADRLPAALRLDLHGELRFRLEGAAATIELDVFNATNADNRARILFDNLFSSAGSFRQFPLLCVIGFRVTV